MIAKISSSNTMYSALSYNQNKVETNRAKVICANRMIETVDGNFDIHTCLQSFEPYLSANKRTEKPVLHISLNPDPKDVLTDEQLSEIAQEYMQKMNYGDQPFIVYKHEDIERQHIHIVSLRVDEYGKKIDDKFEHRRSMNVCRELEQQFGLFPADQKQHREGLPLKPVRPENGDLKQQIANIIRPVARDYRFQSLKEYRALLTLYNIGVEEVRGEAKGKEYRGLIYSALDDNGSKAGVPFKSSLFGKSVGVEALAKRIEKSAETIKNRRLKERSKRVITSAMRTTNNRTDFEKALAKQNMSVLFRANDEGRIYGATFIDHEQKYVFNGSRLGKEFSANIFNDLFNGVRPVHEQPDQKAENAYEQNPKIEKTLEENSNFGGIFDLFSPSSGTVGDDYEEKAFIRRLKKKKRPYKTMNR
jgi:uncharacterized protein